MKTNAEIVYLDSSALVKLVVQETESDALRQFLEELHSWVSSELAVTEVLRAARSHGKQAVTRARALISSLYMVEVNSEVLENAGFLDPSGLRTLDAIHVSSALRMDVRLIVTYDRRMAAAAAHNGMTIVMPGVV